jgi:hypothetical protein
MPKPPLTAEQQAALDNHARHVHPAYDSAYVTFERLTYTHGLLLVECKACGKRSVLNEHNCPHIREGNKARVRSVTFRCSKQNCGSIEVRLYGGCTPQEAEMFLAGDPVNPDREIPEKPEWQT